MKKLLLTSLLFLLLLNINKAFAIEEVSLEPEHLNLGNYISDMYYGKNENTPKALKLFSEDGLEFENSPINSVKLIFFYSGHLTYTHKEHIGSVYKHEFNSVEPKIRVNFNNNKSQAMFDINLTRDLPGYSNWFTEKLNSVYVSHKITPEQTIILGQYARLPNSLDGSTTLFGQDMVNKTQIGRNFGNVMSAGVRNIAKYKYVDYDIGLYDSTRYMKHFGQGLDFTGAVTLKPLANVEEKTGSFKIGSGCTVGKSDVSYFQYSLYTMYDYKKFHATFEYANADGYNGIQQSRNHADGLYGTLKYDITPKLSIVGRYDIYDSNKDTRGTTTKEYSVGITYKLFKRMKLFLDYVISEGHNRPMTNAIMFATRFII